MLRWFLVCVICNSSSFHSFIIFKLCIMIEHVYTLYLCTFRVRTLARILAKCELKKQLARWYFLYLHFLTSENLGPLSVVLIIDINLLSRFLKCRSLTANIFICIHRKTLSMAEVYIGYNLNAQTHTINSPAWLCLSQSYAFLF